MRVVLHSSQELTPSDATTLLGQSENVHVLLHGEYNVEDPLQSKLLLNSNKMKQPGGGNITAADLLAVDW